MHVKPNPLWKAEKERRQLRQAVAELAARANYPRRYQLVANESARNLMACIRPAMPAGACCCPGCREIWETV